MINICEQTDALNSHAFGTFGISAAEQAVCQKQVVAAYMFQLTGDTKAIDAIRKGLA